MGCRVGHPTGLARLTLAARDEAISPSVRAIRNPVAAPPELRRNPVVDDITNHVGSLAVLNQPKCVSAELKIISSLIDAVGSVAFDVDAPSHIGEQPVERRSARL